VALPRRTSRGWTHERGPTATTPGARAAGGSRFDRPLEPRSTLRHASQTKHAPATRNISGLARTRLWRDAQTGRPNRVALAPWATQQLNFVNVVGNVALFALPSAVLWSFGWSLLRTVAAGFVLSLGIELAQSAIPGRTTATADVLCNTLGAAAGWLVAARLSS